MNIEDQKQQIAQLFEGVRVNGIEGTIRFEEGSEDGRIDAVVENTEERMRPLPISFPIREESAEDAVIDAVLDDILSKFITPDEVDSSASSTVLEVTNWTDVLVCAFREYGDHVITQSSYHGTPQVSQIVPSTRAMDRLVCAWIKWRVNHPTESNLGEIEDHPF